MNDWRRIAVYVATGILLASPSTYGQSTAIPNYVSPVDTELTVNSVSVLGVTDNVRGIYAKPLTDLLEHDINKSHRFQYLPASLAGPVLNLDDLESNPDRVKQLGKSIGADALLIGHVSRDRQGTSITLDLFLTNDGWLAAQASVQNYPQFETKKIKDETEKLEQRLFAKLPYEGTILSRTGNQVTVNLGSDDGAKVGQTLNAVMIINVRRHPIFHFIVAAEKEILGQIQLTKVGKTLSFGSVTSEIQLNAIQKGCKVTGLQKVAYPSPTPVNPGAKAVDLPPGTNIHDSQWVPTGSPSFGYLGVRLGIGSFYDKYDLSTSGGIEAKSAVYPSAALTGELWLNPNWILRGEIRQGIISVKNPIAGSTPQDLAISQRSYGLSLGYNILMDQDFWGPKLTFLVGFYQYISSVDYSNPISLTSQSYGGFSLGIEGSLPIDDKRIWTAKAGYRLVLNPGMQESPVSSGNNAGGNSIDQFSLFITKKLGVNLQAIGGLSFELYSTSYNGGGSRTTASGAPDSASTSSQTSTILSGGINYLF